jgi:hypothetical protein
MATSKKETKGKGRNAHLLLPPEGPYMWSGSVRSAGHDEELNQ